MEKPISRLMHGVADFAYIPAISILPEAVGFKQEKSAVNLCRALSGGLLATGLMTRAEWGLVKVIPFKAHLMSDVAVGLFTLSAPWLFGFANNKKACCTFLAMGVSNVLAGLLTKDEEME
ncbi:hypothetical protein ACFSKU_04950 [Pontibacter silvestris]|uniref:SPW repeat-containing protein n=1 Tax=Pontibacter silvestris TaxID=2305183 RepID=A0ABW4WV44_9BACT|nr:hypothetical protein [Pontibacter silvestris]MCC9136884.1 hypothetical protein [Pontibacter silvestris]